MADLDTMRTEELNALSSFRSFYQSLKYAGLEGSLPLDGSLLDTGCGFGDLLCKMHKESPAMNLYGVDMSPHYAVESKKIVPSANIIIADFQKLPFRDGSFDAVVSSNIFDHCFGYSTKFDSERMINEVYRVLKKEGLYFIQDIHVQESNIPEELILLEKMFKRKDKQLFVKN